jgi:hypothetical protein
MPSLVSVTARSTNVAAPGDGATKGLLAQAEITSITAMSCTAGSALFDLWLIIYLLVSIAKSFFGEELTVAKF